MKGTGIPAPDMLPRLLAPRTNGHIGQLAGLTQMPDSDVAAVAVAVSGATLAIELDDAGTRVVRRTTTTPVRNIKAGRPRAASGPGASSRTRAPHRLVKDT